MKEPAAASAQAAADAATDPASTLCKSAITTLSDVVNQVCHLPVEVAAIAIGQADQHLNNIISAAQRALEKATEAIDKANDAISDLTDYVISSVSFVLASTLEAEVSLNFSILNTHTHSTTDYEISLSLKEFEFIEIAQETFNGIFVPIKDTAVEVVTDLKDKVATPTTTHVANARCGKSGCFVVALYINSVVWML